MVSKETPDKSSEISLNPPEDPTQHESYMVALAMSAAEKQIREGTASSQIITHFLKLGTEKEELEKERLRQENLLTEAKILSLETERQQTAAYEEIMTAMRHYSGGELFDKDIDD